MEEAGVEIVGTGGTIIILEWNLSLMNQLVVQMMHTKDYKYMMILKNTQKETVVTQYSVLRKFLTCHLSSITKITPRHLYFLVIVNHHHHPLPP